MIVADYSMMDNAFPEGVTLPLPPEVGSMYLRRGDRGPAVEAVQHALMALGYPLPKYGADGIFGAETEAAVRQFQRDHGLDPDGIVGPLTVKKINEEFAKRKESEPWLVNVANRILSLLRLRLQKEKPEKKMPTVGPVVVKQESTLEKLLPFLVIGGSVLLAAMLVRK